MPVLITPTTELEAVNECLENIGQAPVSSISGDLGVDTQIALSFVRSINRELQAKGWFWNTEKNYPFSPNVDGDILLPANTLSVDSTDKDCHRDVVSRGQRLYDRDNRTYTFTEEILLEIVLGLAFEEIPETARRYIALRSARLFQDRIESNVSQSDVSDEQEAMTALMQEQLRNEDLNALTNNWSTAAILNRRGSNFNPY